MIENGELYGYDIASASLNSLPGLLDLLSEVESPG